MVAATVDYNKADMKKLVKYLRRVYGNCGVVIFPDSEATAGYRFHTENEWLCVAAAKNYADILDSGEN